MAPFTGRTPTGTVALTALVLVSMTETDFDSALGTYAVTPSGLISTSTGSAPTPIVAVTVLLAVLITETLLERV
jgi:hypothetical protein